MPSPVAWPHNAEHQRGKHIGKRVIAATLHFQHRRGVVFEPQFLGTEDGKDGCSVRGTHHGTQQETFRPSPAKDKMAEEPRESRCHNDAKGGEQRGLPHNRPGCIPTGAEAAVEHNEDKGDGTDFLGKDLIFKMQGDQAVVAEEHTQDDKCEQGRDADSG